MEILNGRSMARVAQRVASVMSRRPSQVQGADGEVAQGGHDAGARAGPGGGVVLVVDGVA